MYNPLPGYQFINAVYLPVGHNGNQKDAIVATVKHTETGDTKLHIIESPKTKIYVAKKGCRNYTQKKEKEDLNKLDLYVCNTADMYEVLNKALETRFSSPIPFFGQKKLLQSPFVYGCDIPVELQMKGEYRESNPEGIKTYNVSCGDIETSVLGDNEIISASFCDFENETIYAYINKSWYQPNDTWLNDINELWKKSFDVFYDGLNDKAKKVINKEDWHCEFFMCENETKLITDYIRRIVLAKTDFCGFWNIGFDLPYIIERARFRELDLVELFRHPDVPKHLGMFEWKEDNSKMISHFTDKYHKTIIPGYTYFYDAMCLYSRIRKVQGRDLFYTLDYIGNKIIGTGKVKFGIGEGHYEMQTKNKIGYVVYNTIDTIIPPTMDKLTLDVMSLNELIGPALLNDFSHQTVQLKAQFYEYCVSTGSMSGTTAGSLKQPEDGYIGNIGGAVLTPSLMKRKGVACLSESDAMSYLYMLCCDIDVGSFYPSLDIAMNISKATKLATILRIEGCPYTFKDIDKAANADDAINKAKANAEYIASTLGCYPSIKENAVYLAKEWFKLPNYNEMLDLFQNQEQKELL